MAECSQCKRFDNIHQRPEIKLELMQGFCTYHHRAVKGDYSCKQWTDACLSCGGTGWVGGTKCQCQEPD